MLNKKIEELKRLTASLMMSDFILTNYRDLEWPVHTAVVRKPDGDYLFRIRDSAGIKIEVKLDFVPRNILLAQENVLKLYNRSREFRIYVDRRYNGLQFNTGKKSLKE